MSPDEYLNAPACPKCHCRLCEFERGREAGLEEAIEIVERNYIWGEGTLVCAVQLRARLTQGTDRG
jgi:hypothetical protein